MSWPPPCPRCGGRQGELATSVFCLAECDLKKDAAWRDVEMSPQVNSFRYFAPCFLTPGDAAPSVGFETWVSDRFVEISEDRARLVGMREIAGLGDNYYLVVVAKVEMRACRERVGDKSGTTRQWLTRVLEIVA